MTASDLRIGILGAARIAPMALIRPARQLDGVRVAAVAARDRARAENFAAKHGVATVHDSYDALLVDPEIDAIYNPLPNSLHAEWTLRALDAGKHVLCEKPFTSNAQEAQRVHQ
ncbi:MAG: Gfo/Idh/MocA family oxidoreductase, partial [Polyangiales bacterium]